MANKFLMKEITEGFFVAVSLQNGNYEEAITKIIEEYEVHFGPQWEEENDYEFIEAKETGEATFEKVSSFKLLNWKEKI